jgi:hypothetical protein
MIPKLKTETKPMRAADMLEYLRQQPFVPIRIHLTDGTT